MGCDEVLRLLREREAACRGEAERLRTEMERITALLAMCEEELSRIETACRVVGELPVVHAVSAVVATRVPAARAVPVPEPESGGSGRADARVAAAEFGEEVLAVLGRYAGPVRCGQIVEGLGLQSAPRQVERVRHHLKKAAEAGRVVKTPGGLFTLARGAGAAGG